MAYVASTATDALDWHNQLVDFLVNNTDLVAAGENWAIAQDDQNPIEWVNYDVDTRWLDDSSSNLTTSGAFLEMKYVSPITISSITLSGPGNSGYDPLDVWNLYYSNDGVTWILLVANTTGVASAQPWSYTVTFATTTAQYWKFEAAPSTIRELNIIDLEGNSRAYTFTRRTWLYTTLSSLPQPVAVLVESDNEDTYGWVRVSAYVCDPTTPSDISLWNNKSSLFYAPCAVSGSQPVYFFGSGRRFITMLNTGTTDEGLYVGLLKPVAPSSRYTYPCFVSGTAYDKRSYIDTDFRYRFSIVNSHYCPTTRRSVMMPDGIWAGSGRTTSTGTTVSEYTQLGCPYTYKTGLVGIFPKQQNIFTVGGSSYENIDSAFAGGDFSLDLNGNPILVPCHAYTVIEQKYTGNWFDPDNRCTPYDGILGEVDGVYHVSGSITSGTLITIGTVNYRVFQGGYKAGGNHMVAIKEA